VSILLLQLIGGYYSNSLALYSDAGHVFGDNIAIFVAMSVAIIPRFGFSMSKVDSVGTRINITLLFLIAIWILTEAWDRYQNPEPVASWTMIIIAAIGGFGNYIQHRIHGGAAHEHKNETHRTLHLHIIADLIQSIGVVIGGIVILFTDYTKADPIVSAAIAFWILYRAIGFIIPNSGDSQKKSS
jgi:cobalt-zinc-cadmium efflux system protein